MFHEKKFLPSTQLLAWYRWFSNWKEFCLGTSQVKAEDHLNMSHFGGSESWRAMKHSDREEPRPVGGGRQSEGRHASQPGWSPSAPGLEPWASFTRLPWASFTPTLVSRGWGLTPGRMSSCIPPVCLTQTPARWDDLGLLRALWLEYFKNSNWISLWAKVGVRIEISLKT